MRREDALSACIQHSIRYPQRHGSVICSEKSENLLDESYTFRRFAIATRPEQGPESFTVRFRVRKPT